jgi:hypothetical protein
MNKRDKAYWSATAAGILATIASGVATQAQSSDALLDKLVDKGILTVKEANDLKEESDKNFTTAFQVKSGMPDWVNSFKLNGDFRGRYEGFYSDSVSDRNRFRYRLRFGAVATLKDDFEVGFRLTSSEAARNGGSGGDPISGNTTMTSNGSKKLVYIDLAYGKWSPIHNNGWEGSFSVGKIQNPFQTSDMVFDGDYTPEGFSQQFGYNFNEQHALRMNLGEFAVNEVSGSSQDSYLFGAQLRFDSKWNKRWETTFGVGGFALTDENQLNASSGSTFSVPDQNGGNSRSATATGAAGGYLLSNYNPVVADAYATYYVKEVPYYPGDFPIRFGGEYMNNPGADEMNEGYNLGVQFGKSGKKGTWDVSYRYKELQGDAWYDQLVDSDFGAVYNAASARSTGLSTPGYIAGTNVRGHVIRANYSPYDSLTLGLTCFITEAIDEATDSMQTTRLQVDAMWKF